MGGSCHKRNNEWLKIPEVAFVGVGDFIGAKGLLQNSKMFIVNAKLNLCLLGVGSMMSRAVVWETCPIGIYCEAWSLLCSETYHSKRDLYIVIVIIIIFFFFEIICLSQVFLDFLCLFYDCNDIILARVGKCDFEVEFHKMSRLGC